MSRKNPTYGHHTMGINAYDTYPRTYTRERLLSPACENTLPYPQNTPTRLFCM